MKGWKKSLSLLLCSLFLTTPLMACGDGNGEQANGDNDVVLNQDGSHVNDATDVAGNEIKRPSYYEVPEEFRWVAYSTPPNANVGVENTPYEGNPDYNTVANWQTLAACGFNYAQPIHYDVTDEDKIKTLQNAEEVGVKIIFPSTDNVNPDSLGYISSQGGTYQEAYNRILANEGKIKARYEKFMQYESFAGIFGCDEPNATKFEAIAAAQDWFEDNYPQYEFYVNLLPEYASNEQLFGELAGTDGYKSYADHVARFCETVNPYILSYDHYCLTDTYTYFNGFFYNLAVGAINSKALEDAYGWEVPFYIYLQSMGFEWKAEIRFYEQWAWQVYNSLAFGVTGVQTFNYWPHMAVLGNGNAPISNALVDREGNKTKVYDYVKKTIDDISAMEEVYLSYNWEHASAWTPKDATRSGLLNELEGWEGYVDEASGERVRAYTDISDIKTTQEIIIGQFKSRTDGGKKAYMVSNASDVQKAAQAGASVGSSQAGQTKALEYASKVTLTFANNVQSVNLYKPGSNGVTENVVATNGVVEFTIPLGEGFFVVPVYNA